MNLIEIQNRIISEKIKLRKKSKNFVNNFKKIEKYIQKEVAIIKESKDSIIPEIKFEDISIKDQTIIKDKVFKRGCIIIRNVFDKKKARELNKDLDKFLDNIVIIEKDLISIFERNNIKKIDTKNNVLIILHTIIYLCSPSYITATISLQISHSTHVFERFNS